MNPKQFRLYTNGWETAGVEGLKARLFALEDQDLTEDQIRCEEKIAKRLNELQLVKET